MKLGKLKEIDIRKVWAHEQYDFSRWLANEDNIQELGDVLGLSLTDIETEKPVGNYRCDILCKDETTGKLVLIENQLEPTNHDHLGKIITYASGLDAAVIVWVVAEARSEHASAIQWLNAHTDEGVAFFLLEIHAFVIGDSAPAPKFTIIEKPNDFVKTVKTLAASGDESDTKAQYLEFWTQFNEVLEARGKPFKKRTPPTVYSYRIPLGSSHYRIDIELQKKRKFIDTCLWIHKRKDLFDEAYAHKDEIEAALGFSLHWYRLDQAKACAISAHIPGFDFEDKSNYPELMNEAIDKVIAMRDTIIPYIKAVP